MVFKTCPRHVVTRVLQVCQIYMSKCWCRAHVESRVRATYVLIRSLFLSLFPISCRFLNVFWTLAWRARRLVKICWLSHFLFLFLLCLSDGMVEFSHCFNALIVPVFTLFFTLKGGSKLVTIMYWFFLFSEMCFKSIKLLFCRNVLVIAQQIHSLLSAAKI